MVSFFTADSFQGTLNLLKPRKYAIYLFVQSEATRIRSETPSFPLEQFHTRIRFKMSDQFASSGLGDTQQFCRTTDGSCLNDSLESFDLAEVWGTGHAITFSNTNLGFWSLTF
jgi:hypothetical protein